MSACVDVGNAQTVYACYVLEGGIDPIPKQGVSSSDLTVPEGML
jgi:hypothetical protein